MQKLLIVFLVILAGWLRPQPLWGQDSRLFIQTSMDVAKHILTGPSYEDFVAHYNTFGFNVCLYFDPARAEEELKDDYNLSKRHPQPSRLNPATLLASINSKAGPTAPDPNAGSSFLSHISPLVGIQLIGKGGKLSDRFGKSITHMTYLEIPVYAIYNYKLPEEKGRLFGGLGIYLAYGLWGTLKYDDPSGQESFSAFDKLNGYKRFDAGLNFMVGYQHPQGLRLSLVQELGLTSIDPVAGSDKTRNSVWSLNVGYPLRKLTALVKKK